ncbi:hypothetical protein CU633_03785 [Bacillus sp. V3-13]|uniref:hypothetical protein n=1 Tax=Bacillus sp. V3-13 TaxID=2053728 RepID=UPI000C76384C|nr:hypothetical protein [Bacillus sp. V3-13]PLR78685.1 hypothetical protein CU633_03785 [Bacillus sp. V3-13]
MYSSLQNLLYEKKISLIASLPENNPILARAAIQAGADAIKMHVNVQHQASGNSFDATEVYQDQFREIRGGFSGPIGIVPGGACEAITASEMEQLTELGFNYFSIYAHHMPTWMLNLNNFEKTFAISCDYSPDGIGEVTHLGVTALEASIIPGSEYGSPLTFRDILAYNSLVQHTDIPVLVPSQRKLAPSDILSLYKAGVKAVMLGAIVVGKTEESIKSAVSSFRDAIDSL